MAKKLRVRVRAPSSQHQFENFHREFTDLVHAMYKGETVPSDEKEPSLLDDQVECLPPPGDDLPYGENPVGTVLEQPESIQISANGLKI